MKRGQAPVCEASAHVDFLKSSTNWIFGARARLRASDPIRVDNLENCDLGRDLLLTISSEFSENTDGHVFIFKHLTNDFGFLNLRKLVRTFFFRLSDVDPRERHCMMQNLASPDWVFEFAGVSFYPIVLSSCYPPDSSRHVSVEKTSYIVLLFQSAFRRRHTDTRSNLSESVRLRIREKFTLHDMIYDLSITLGPCEAYKILKPMHFGDTPENWWK